MMARRAVACRSRRYRVPEHVKASTRLSPTTLVLVGDFGPAGSAQPTISLMGDEHSEPLESRWFAARDAGPDAEGQAGTGVLMIAMPDPGKVLYDEADLVLDSGRGGLEVTGRALVSSLTDLQTLMRRHLAPLPADVRTKLVEFFGSSLNLAPKLERHELGERLFEIREALRERLPAFIPNDRCKAHVDRLIAVDERSFLIEGWIHHLGIGKRITVVSPEGARVELIERVARYPRPDVTEFLFDAGKDARDEAGFICFFELEAPSILQHGWVLEIEAEDDCRLELPLPMVLSDALEARDALLHGPYIETISTDEFMSDHVFPTVSRIQHRLHGAVGVEPCLQLGEPPTSPDVSIVVPLGSEVGQLEVQLSQFADDPELHEADLVYLLDSPEALNALDHVADVFPIYRVPFRIAVPDQAVGFAGAANAGARLARGRLLLLMEPDVVPARPGWLGEMRAFYDATPSIGALGPKLLYEDDSIQHAGTYFFKRPGSPEWRSATHFKGMHRALPVANETRPVAAVSRACLMVDRAMYERVEGLPTVYVGEGRETSDLCLRLSSEGLESWYFAGLELYHPEEPSRLGSEPVGERYDEWLHDHRWHDRIGVLMADHDLVTT
jgi:hypothetical protein